MGFYKHSSYMSGGTYGFGFTGDMAPEEKPYWFLRDINGDLIIRSEGNLRMLDIGHPEVQTMWASSCMKAFSQYPFDWVKADVLKVNAPWIGTARGKYPVNPRTGNPYTHEEWCSDTIEFMKTVKSIIGTKLILGYMSPSAGSSFDTSPSGSKSRYDRIVNEIDGVEMEGALRWEYPREETWRSEDKWIQDLALITELCRKGKIVLVYCLVRELAPDQTLQQMMDFGLASFLLSMEGSDAVICLRDGWLPGTTTPRPEWYPNQFKGKIGNPLANYYQDADGLFETRRQHPAIF